MINNVKTKILRSIKNKRLNVFGLFFLIAFLILVVTKLSDNYIENLSLTIVYKNLPETHIITMDSVSKVNVTVTSNGFNLLTYYLRDNNYVIDMESSVKTQGTTYVWVADKNLYNIKTQLGKSVEIVSVAPDTLVMPFGILSSKRIPVVLDSKINFESGYDTLKGIEIMPDSVNIIGADKDIATINYVKTRPLQLEGVKSPINTTVNLVLENASDRLKLSETTVTVKADVEKFTEGTFEVPVTMRNVPNNIEVNYFPKQIKVAYYLSLKDYETVKPTDFKIECDYKNRANGNASYFIPKLIVNAESVKSAKMKQNKVEYIIVK